MKEKNIEKESKLKIINKIGDYIYDLQVKLHSRKSKKPKRKQADMNTQKMFDLVFYISALAIPTIMFIFNNIIINGNSFILAFSKFSMAENKFSFAGFENFKSVMKNFFTLDEIKIAWANSVKVYVIAVIVTTVIPVLFSYCIYKKIPGHRFFKVVLFMPSIISAIITITIYKIMVEEVVPDLWERLFNVQMNGLLGNPKTTFSTVMFYYLWMSFGGGLLIQLGAMNAIDDSVVEYAKIDGAGFFQEFWYINLPATYQVISIGFILGFSSLFSNDLGLYAFYGTGAPHHVQTLGYYFTIKTLDGTNLTFPHYAAWGLIVSAIAIPVTLLLRHVIYKYGPSED